LILQNKKHWYKITSEVDIVFFDLYKLIIWLSVSTNYRIKSSFFNENGGNDSADTTTNCKKSCV
jgi:hypothetical protein